MPTGREVIGLFAAVIILAGFTVAVKNGSGVVQILDSGGKAFSNVISAATRG